MKRFWTLLEVVIYGLVLLLFLDNLWTPLLEAYPTPSLKGLLEQQQAGLLTGAAFGLLIASLAYRFSRPARKVERTVNRWQEPTGPGPEASPMDAIRFFPGHTLVCALLVVAALVAFWMHPGAAMLLLVGALMAAVTLARRLGLEPQDDPAAPHNQQRTR
ncbi:MAG: hypothetical protein ACI8U3_002404 [Brevundimonas sp.]